MFFFFFFFSPNKAKYGEQEIIINNINYQYGDIFQFEGTKAWIIYIDSSKDLIILSKSKLGDLMLKSNKELFSNDFSLNTKFKDIYNINNRELTKLNIRAYKVFEKGKESIAQIIDLTQSIKTVYKLI